MGFLFTILMIGVLIFVHEFGHFVVAKSMGVMVLKFSLGFGTPILKYKYKETEYQIGWIPLGGYVKMLGESPDEDLHGADLKRSFYYQSPQRRLLIVLAGPVMNLLFPLLIYFIVYALPSEEISNRIGMVMEGRPAERAGIKRYDRIIEVDGKRTDYWRNLLKEISSRPGRTVEMKIERDGRVIPLKVNIAAEKEVSRYGFSRTVGRIGVSPYMPAAVIYVRDEDSEAYKAGFRSFDLIKKVDGRDVESFYKFEVLLKENAGKRVSIEVLRGVEKRREEIYLDKASDPESLGIEQAELFIYKVEKGSPADKAGIREGDKLVSINGERLLFFAEIESHFARDPDREHEFGVVRGDQLLNIKVRLEKEVRRDEYKQEYNYFRFGASNNSFFTDGEIVKKGFTFLDAVANSVDDTLDVIKATVVGVYQLASGQVSFKTVGGPIMIFGIAGKAAKKGMNFFLHIMALISINLGIINLLPLPVLDGGHVIMSLVEMISRRSIPVKAKIIINLIGIIIILLLTVLVIFNDLLRYSDDIISWFSRVFR